MSEFQLAENCKLGLMPNKGIAQFLSYKRFHPDLGNGIPRRELYLYVENRELEFENAIKIYAQFISPLEERNWGDKVCYFADSDWKLLRLQKN